MTVFQLKVAMSTKKNGTVSAAATELGISQPNASSALKNLEHEIGYKLFERTKNGAKPTDKGLFFLEHAKHILNESDSIMAVANKEKIYRLRLGTVNYYSAIEPFIKICEKHRDDKECDFTYNNVSIDEGITKLENYELDVVFSPVLKSQVIGFKEKCKRKNLDILSLGEIPAVVSVRKGHPAIAKGECINLTQGSNAMKDYPYVAYRNLSEDDSKTGYNDENFAQSSYVMYVDEVNIRLRIVASTNAFSFGIVPSRGVNYRYGIESFPVPGISLEIFCVTRKSEINKKEIQEYITLLKEELSAVTIDNKATENNAAQTE